MGGGEESPQSVFQVSISQFFFLFFAPAELLQRITASASPSVLRRSLKTFCLFDTEPSEGQLGDNPGTTRGQQRPARVGNKWLIKEERKCSLEQLVKMEERGKWFYLTKIWVQFLFI